MAKRKVQLDHIIIGKTYYWKINLPEGYDYYISTKGEVITKNKKFLNRKYDKYGYAKVNLHGYVDEERKVLTKYIHRLLYQVFLYNNEPLQPYQRVVFKDRDKTNLTIDSLVKIAACDLWRHAKGELKL